jgi:hypothetical protein
VGNLVPLLDDKKEAVRDREAAGFLRLEVIRLKPVNLVLKPLPK